MEKAVHQRTKEYPPTWKTSEECLSPRPGAWVCAEIRVAVSALLLLLCTIYTNGQILAQSDGGQSASKYFYVNDRLGSVRQVIDMSGSVKRNYTYSPFGQLLESGAASGGSYVLSGTIGQPDAAYSAGGQYEVLGGFWPGEPLCIVDFRLFAKFAEDWLKQTSWHE